MDILEPIDASNFDHNFPTDKLFFLCMTDIYTRCTEIELTDKIDANKIVKIFRDACLEKFPLPKQIITDRGKQFISSKFKRLTQKRNIKHIFTCAYNPEENGIVERINRKILSAIRTCEQKDIEKCREIIWRNVNLLKIRTTGFSPIEMITEKTITGKKINKE